VDIDDWMSSDSVDFNNDCDELYTMHSVMGT
jgi:hypothetical protein